ncbi:N-acetylglucosamine-6-phosphate deacetylase [Paenibacillus thermoaerophilus]|uniref:N-acetylglucosamine-6-phosphate deacetylase n=1 Tax=Paenibacillus thermoaerophilus TaxID=1215385 RepID=A0ABW2V284_9BACL|nr:amidohydrolase family protein [Paenibacillus thermoaerophilus]
MANGDSYEIRGRHLFTHEPVAVRIHDGKIRSISAAGGFDAREEELWIAPGLIDLQINGFAGYDLNLSGVPMEPRVEAVIRMSRAVLRTGTTTFFPTIITAGFEQILDSMTAIRLACEQDPLVDRMVAGIHLEGPYLSELDGPRGAHPKAHIKDPDWTEFMKWQEASGNRIKLVTLAPERPGAISFIEQLVRHGIVASVGHTAASPEEIGRAAEAGARMSTHLGNGAHPQLPRHPNYIWSQLAEDRLWASVIADGHHLHASVLKVISAVKQDRLVLVSDAVHLAGLPPGIYNTHVGGRVELLETGRLQMADNPLLLAGAAVSLMDCVQHMYRALETDLAAALQMATVRPATLIGLSQGRMETGAMADLILFRWNKETKSVQIRQVLKHGTIHTIG